MNGRTMNFYMSLFVTFVPCTRDDSSLDRMSVYQIDYYYLPVCVS